MSDHIENIGIRGIESQKPNQKSEGDSMKNKRREISELLRNNKMTPHEAREAVLKQMSKEGRFYKDDYRVLYVPKDGTVYQIQDLKGAGIEDVLSPYNLFRGDTFFRKVANFVITSGRQKAKKIKVHHLSYYQESNNQHYFFDFDRSIYKIRENGVTQVPNGTDDVVFVNECKAESFCYDEQLEKGNLLNEHVFGKMNLINCTLSAEEQKALIKHWLLSIFFKELNPTRMLLLLTGPQASGKSLASELMGHVIYGKRFRPVTMPSSEKDFDTLMSNHIFFVIDNAETSKRWLEDRLAVASTGYQVSRRKLYKDNELFESDTDSLVGITAIDPVFRRLDVANRLLIAQFGQLNRCIESSQLLADVDTNRNAIMSELIGLLKNTLGSLAKHPVDEKASSHRMADFFEFVRRTCDADDADSYVQDLFDKLAIVQSEFANGGNLEVNIAKMWINKHLGEELSTRKIFDSLKELCESLIVKSPFGEFNSFAQKFKLLAGKLAQEYSLHSRGCGGHRTLYTFSKTGDETLDA